MARRGSHRKAKSLWQRLWPIMLGIAAVTAAVVVLILYGSEKLMPLVTTPAAVMADTTTTTVIQTTTTVTETTTTVAETTTETTTTMIASTAPTRTPKPSPTPQPTPVDLEYPYYIVINQGAQLVTVYTLDRDGKYTVPVRYMICSTGERGKTPNGLFRIKERHRWQQMLASTPTYAQYATRITGSYLFHSVNFTAARPDKLKVSNYNNLGTVDSGGCVRLQVADAKWVYDNIPKGTPVRIYNGPPQPDITTKLLPTKLPTNAKWDPSDPDENNPDPHPVIGATILNTPYPGVTPAPLEETFSRDVPRVTRTLPPQ